MAETSTIFGFMKYVSATDILSDFKKTVDSHFVNSLTQLNKVVFFFNLYLDIYRFFVKMVDGILCLTSFHFLIEGGV